MAPAPDRLHAYERWFYIDAQGTFEARAGFVAGPPRQFVAIEIDTRHRDEPYLERIDYAEQWEAVMRHWEYETRLALMGTIDRYDFERDSWRRLRPAIGTPVPDLRNVPIDGLPEGVLVHHYHDHAAKRDVIFVVKARRAQHFAIRKDVSDLDDALNGRTFALAHDAPTAVAKSLMMREHLALHGRGATKLTTAAAFRARHGDGWQDALRARYREIFERMDRGVAAVPKRRAESAYVDYERILNDARVRALCEQFLSHGEEDELLRRGEARIRQQIAAKRKAATDAHDQLMLTVLEAALLAHDAILHGEAVPAAAASVLRRFVHYV